MNDQDNFRVKEIDTAIGSVKDKPVRVILSSMYPVAPIGIVSARQILYLHALANLLELHGCEVHRECHIYTKGELVDWFALSIYLRYLDLCGVTLDFPENGFQGDYIYDFAASVHRQYGNQFNVSDAIADEISNLSEKSGRDTLLRCFKNNVGIDILDTVKNIGVQSIVKNIQSELKELGINCSMCILDTELTQENFPHKTSKFECVDTSYIAASCKIDDKTVANNVYQEEATNVIAQHTDGYNVFIAAVKVIDQFEPLSISPFSEDFVSFREIRQRLGDEHIRVLLLAPPETRLEIVLENTGNANIDVVKNAASHLNNIGLCETGETVSTGEYLLNNKTHSGKDATQHEFLTRIDARTVATTQAAKDYKPDRLLECLIQLAREILAYYNEKRGDGCQNLSTEYEKIVFLSAKHTFSSTLPLLGLEKIGASL